MEEVWKDITLASDLNPNPNIHFQNLTFQDFLSQPFCNRNSNQTASATASSGGYPSPVSPPPIALSLNSGPERFNSMCHHSDRFRQNNFISNVPFDELVSGPGLPELGRKRYSETENPGDRRHKRMIKNRESAARSRARRQAYTNELELEVAHLTEENARLRKQQQLSLAAASSQVPKKHTLRRASTPPF